MTVSALSLVFDVVLAGLLAAMIFYAVRLNRRILMLRERETEMQTMIMEFNQSSAAAHASASALKSAGTEAEVGVKAAIAKATALRNDLAAMIDQGNALCNRLDYKATAEAQAETTARARRPPLPEPRDREPREAAPASPPATPPASRTAPPNVANLRPFAPPARAAADVVNAAPQKEQGDLQPRTEAERQLLEAIRAAKEGVA